MGPLPLLLGALLGISLAVNVIPPISTAPSALPKVQCSAAPGPFFKNLKPPFPTNAWWSGLGVGDQTSYAAGPFPFQTQTSPKGVTFALPQKRTFDGKTVHTDYSPELNVGAAELSTSKDLNTYSLVSFDDLSLRIRWSGPSGKTFDSYLVQGSPYMTFAFNGLTPSFTPAPQKDTFVSLNGQTGSATGTKFKIVTQNNIIWVVYFDSQVQLSFSSSSISASQGFTGIVRVAKIVDPSQEVILDKYQTIYVTGTSITYTVVGNSARLVYNFQSNKGTPLMMTWPHHRDAMAFNLQYLPLQYLTIKGYMKGLVGSSWTMTYNLTTIKWFPNANVDSTCSAELARSLDYEIKHTDPPVPNDMYFWGGSFGRLARMALIAEHMGRSDLQAAAVSKLKTSFQPWLSGTAGSPACYETGWGGVVSRDGAKNVNVDFGNGFYNDHHFHYGYHLYGAAVIAKNDNTWFAGAKDYLNGLARDIGNPSSTDPYFTVARHKDWFAGHSWASGVGYNGGNRNAESSTESVNGYFGLYSYALVTGDQKLIDWARLLLAQEIHSTQRYWHLTDYKDPSYIEAGYRALATAGNVNSDSSGQWLWWGSGQKSQFAAIQILPATPITAEVVDLAWGKAMYQHTAPDFPDPNVSDDWKSVVYIAHSTFDAPAAYQEARSLTSWGTGNSNSNTLYLIATRGTTNTCNAAAIPTPPLGSSITFQSKSTGKFVGSGAQWSATGGVALAAAFSISWVPGGYNIQAVASGSYVSGQNGGRVTANTATPRGWESFRFVQQGNYWAIVSSSNRGYLTVNADGSITSNGASISDATLFTIAAAPAAVVFKAGDYRIKNSGSGLYISQGTDNKLTTSATAVVFKIATVTGGFSIRSSRNSLFVTADGAGTGPLAAARDVPGGWETFNFVSSGSLWLIQANVNGGLVTPQATGYLVPSSRDTNAQDQWSFESA